MHRSSLPIAFNSTRTLTDVVSLEQLSTNQYGSNHYNLDSHDTNLCDINNNNFNDLNNNNSNTSISMDSMLESKNQSIESEVIHNTHFKSKFSKL